MMEKRNVATPRRDVSAGPDEDMVDRAASLLSGSEKRSSSRSESAVDDDMYDEDTGTGDRRK